MQLEITTNIVFLLINVCELNTFWQGNSILMFLDLDHTVISNSLPKLQPVGSLDEDMNAYRMVLDTVFLRLICMSSGW